MNFKEFLTEWEIIEEKKSSYDVLKNNKVPLTDEERTECFKKECVWHNGMHDSKCAPHCKVPAVWKSKHPKTGKMTYVTATHRAYNTAPSLKGAIGRFHKFIKSTA